MIVPRLTISIRRCIYNLHLLKIYVLEILIALLDPLLELLEVFIITCHVLLLGSLALIRFTGLCLVTLVICLIEGRQYSNFEYWNFLLRKVLYKVSDDRAFFFLFLKHFVNKFSEILRVVRDWFRLLVLD